MGPVSLKPGEFLCGVESRRLHETQAAHPAARLVFSVLRTPEMQDFRAGGIDPLLEAMDRSLRQGASLRGAYLLLSLDQRSRLETAIGKTLLEECLHIASETDLAIAESALLTFGKNLEAKGKAVKAMQVYRALLDSSVHAEAESSMAAMLGSANFGTSFEGQLRGFAAQSTDYRMIVPMIAGTVAYGAIRSATLGAWAQEFGISKARWLVRAFGFAVEVPVFSVSARFLDQVSGTEISWDSGYLVKDLVVTAMTLSVLKASGAVGHQAQEALARRSSGLASLTGAVLPQGGIFLGLLGLYSVQSQVGLRETSPGVSLPFEALVSLVSLGVGAKLGQWSLGRAWPRLEAEWRIRSESLKDHNALSFEFAQERNGISPEQGQQVPLRFRSIYRAAREAGSAQFLLHGGIDVLESKLGPHFNPYLLRISPPTQEMERLFADSDFEIYLRRSPAGTAIVNGRPEGSHSRQDGLYLVRDGAWQHPLEVKLISLLSRGDFVLWRRGDGERQIRVFLESVFPLRWEDFPAGKLKFRKVRDAPSVMKAEASRRESTGQASPEPQESYEVPQLPMPDIAAEEFWLDPSIPGEKNPMSTEADARPTLEIGPEDIVSERSVDGEGSAAEGSVELLDIEGVRSYFELGAEMGFPELQRKIVGYYSVLDEGKTEALNRITHWAFSKDTADRAEVGSIRDALKSQLFPWGLDRKSMWQAALGELSHRIGMELLPWILMTDSASSGQKVHAIISHFFPDASMLHAGMKGDPMHTFVGSEIFDMELRYGAPPSRESSGNRVYYWTTLGEFRRRVFPWIEPWMGRKADLETVLPQLWRGIHFRIDGKSYFYRIESVSGSEGESHVFTLVMDSIHGDRTAPQMSPKGGVEGGARFALRRFEVRAPKVDLPPSGRDHFLSVMADFLEDYQVPLDMMPEESFHDLLGRISLALLETPGSPSVLKLKNFFSIHPIPGEAP